MNKREIQQLLKDNKVKGIFNNKTKEFLFQKAQKLGLIPMDQKMARIGRKVVAINVHTEERLEFNTLVEACKRLNVTPSGLFRRNNKLLRHTYLIKLNCK